MAPLESTDIGSRAGRTLRELGYGVHETRVILALNRLGPCTVSDLSSATNVQAANLYSILDSLANRGIVATSGQRPRIYDFIPLGHLQDLLTVKVDQLISDLEEIQEQRGPVPTSPTLIYTIKGRADVQAKMQSMILNAEVSVMLVAPDALTLGDVVMESLKTAAQKGVRIRIIHGAEPIKADFPLEQRIKENTLAVDLIIDEVEALISMPDLSISGWTDIAMISLQLGELLQQTWSISKKV